MTGLPGTALEPKFGDTGRPYYMGVAASIGCSLVGPIKFIVNNNEEGNRELKVGTGIGVSVVFGTVPGKAETGGARAGIGIAGGITITSGYKTSLTVKISIGFTGSGLIPLGGDIANCPLGPSFWTPLGTLGCFVSYAVTMSALCCTWDVITGDKSCDR